MTQESISLAEAMREQAVKDTLAWLKADFGYTGDDLPKGEPTFSGSCPVAVAIAMTGRSDVRVHETDIAYYDFKTGHFVTRSTPEFAQTFIDAFDAGLLPRYVLEPESLCDCPDCAKGDA